MPGLQALQGIPSFGGGLGQALGGGLSQGIGMALSQMLEQKQQDRKTKALFDALGLGSNQEVNQPSGIQNQGKQNQGGSLPQLTQEKILAASIQNPALAPALGAIYKNQQKEAEKQQSIDTAQRSFDTMGEIFQRGNIGLGSGLAISGKTAEDVGEFETLSGALESLLKDQVNKGTLSNARFDYIVNKLLPKPTDPRARIKGKLRGLAKELNLKSPEFLSEKHLDKEEAKEILKQAKGDVNKARKIAKAKGYEF